MLAVPLGGVKHHNPAFTTPIQHGRYLPLTTTILFRKPPELSLFLIRKKLGRRELSVGREISYRQEALFPANLV